MKFALPELHDAVGDGYGSFTDNEVRLIERMGRLGVRLDTTYTAKAATSLRDMVVSGSIPAEGTVLFVHTGGTNQYAATHGGVTHA